MKILGFTPWKTCLLLFMTNTTCDDNDNGPMLSEGDDYIFFRIALLLFGIEIKTEHSSAFGLCLLGIVWFNHAPFFFFFLIGKNNFIKTRLLHEKATKFPKELQMEKISTYELILWKIEHRYRLWDSTQKTTHKEN